MSGVSGDGGYIFQRKVALYRILAAFVSSTFRSVTLEFSMKTADKWVFGDILLHENLAGHKLETFIEVKSSEVLEKKDICEIIDNFTNIEHNRSVDRYELIHSCQRISFLLKVQNDPKVLEDALPHIPNCMLNPLMKKVCNFHYPETKSDFLDYDDLELRTIILIDKILTRFEIYGFSTSARIYESLRLKLENTVHEEAKRLKDSKYSLNPAHSPSFLELKIDDLFSVDNGLYQQILNQTNNNNIDEIKLLLKSEFNMQIDEPEGHTYVL